MKRFISVSMMMLIALGGCTSNRLVAGSGSLPVAQTVLVRGLEAGDWVRVKASADRAYEGTLLEIGPTGLTLDDGLGYQKREHMELAYEEVLEVRKVRGDPLKSFMCLVGLCAAGFIYALATLDLSGWE